MGREPRMNDNATGFRKWLLELGPVRVTILLGGLCVAVSAVITRVLVAPFTTPDVMIYAVGVSVLVPALIAPVTIWALMRMLIEVESARARQSELLAELSQAYEEVRTLEGMLPICASCKDVRDDRGYWHQVENFVSHRSSVEFSHSICPDCVRELYPEVADEVIAQNERREAVSPC